MLANELIDRLERLALLDQEIIEALREQLDQGGTRVTPEAVAKLLVDNGQLTRFQATKLIGELRVGQYDDDAGVEVVEVAEVDELGNLPEEGAEVEVVEVAEAEPVEVEVFAEPAVAEAVPVEAMAVEATAVEAIAVAGGVAVGQIGHRTAMQTGSDQVDLGFIQNLWLFGHHRVFDSSPVAACISFSAVKTPTTSSRLQMTCTTSRTTLVPKNAMSIFSNLWRVQPVFFGG